MTNAIFSEKLDSAFVKLFKNKFSVSNKNSRRSKQRSLLINLKGFYIFIKLVLLKVLSS
jgi:hypothetical protein